MANFWESNPFSSMMRGIGDAFNWGPDIKYSPTAHTAMAKGDSPFLSEYLGQFPGLTNASGDEGGSLFGLDSWGDIGGLAQGIGGIFQGYAALQGLDLADKQFGFSKAMANRQWQANAKNYNNRLYDRSKARYNMSNKAVSNTVHPDEKLAKWGVDESKIG